MANITDTATLISNAIKAGLSAGHTAMPTPMRVIGAGGTEVWQVSEGVCGFAWVNVKPGNSRIAKALVAANLARKDSYEGGVTVWVHEFNQSMARKEAYARAFAKVLTDAGIRAYASSRMD